MRTYTFTYFCKLDGDEFLQSHEYSVSCNRLSHAVVVFADFFNNLPGIRDYSTSYRVTCDTTTSFRRLSSRCFHLFDRNVPDFCL